MQQTPSITPTPLTEAEQKIVDSCIYLPMEYMFDRTIRATSPYLDSIPVGSIMGRHIYAHVYFIQSKPDTPRITREYDINTDYFVYVEWGGMLFTAEIFQDVSELIEALRKYFKIEAFEEEQRQKGATEQLKSKVADTATA